MSRKVPMEPFEVTIEVWNAYDDSLAEARSFDLTVEALTAEDARDRISHFLAHVVGLARHPDSALCYHIFALGDARFGPESSALRDATP